MTAEPFLLDDCYARFDEIFKIQNAQQADIEIMLKEKKLLEEQINMNINKLTCCENDIHEIIVYFQKINMHEPYFLPPNHV